MNQSDLRLDRKRLDRKRLDRKRLDRKRLGFTSTELVVASSLLVAVMAIIGPLTVRTTRLWKDSRHQQLAIEELSTELERLTAMEPDRRAEAIASLSPSESLQWAAPNADIKAETIRDADGTRIVMTLDWNEANYPRAPMKLIGWLDPLPVEETP